MNIGFFLGFIFSGFMDLKGNYGKIFEISNLINIVTVFLIFKSWNHLDNKNTNIQETIRRKKDGIMSIVCIIPILVVGFYYSGLANYLILAVGIAALIYIYFLGLFTKDKIVRGKIYSYLILTISSIVFWMLYFVGPMGVTQFLKHNVEIYIIGYCLPPQWIMNLNTILVIFGSPILIMFFTKLRKRGVIISISRQFVASLLFISLSFFVLIVGISEANSEGLTGGNWIVLHYIFQAIGELLIAPVGYAMIGKLAPKKLQGMMMGVWMMASGISVTLSHYFSNIMTSSTSLNPLISNQHYTDAFSQLSLYALLGSIVLLYFSSSIEKNIGNLIGKETEALI